MWANLEMYPLVNALSTLLNLCVLPKRRLFLDGGNISNTHSFLFFVHLLRSSPHCKFMFSHLGGWLGEWSCRCRSLWQRWCRLGWTIFKWEEEKIRTGWCGIRCWFFYSEVEEAFDGDTGRNESTHALGWNGCEGGSIGKRRIPIHGSRISSKWPLIVCRSR